MTAVPKRNDLDARLQRLERAVRDLSRSNVIPLPGPPGPPGPIEGTTIEASVEMLAPSATFDELTVTGNASVGGALDAATVQATAEIQSPLATISSLVTAPRVLATDRTFAVGRCTTAVSGVTTAIVDVPGMAVNVDVDSPFDIYHVTVVLDVDQVADTTGTLLGRLLVGGVTQTGMVIWKNTGVAADRPRFTVSQVFLVSGLSAGTTEFKVQVNRSGGVGDGHRVNTVHSNMTIAQQQ